jgi:hypothetical protein
MKFTQTLIAAAALVSATLAAAPGMPRMPDYMPPPPCHYGSPYYCPHN